MRTTTFSSPRRALQALRLAMAVLGIGLVAIAGQARAAEDDDESFEDKIIRNIMQGLGGTNMENTGIEYRERSPLVVPPKIDLPPPNANAEINTPNWPKDPDVQRRKAERAAAAKKKLSPEEAARPLMPNELAANRTAPEKRSIDSNTPGDPNANPILSPSQLGFTGFKSMFGGNVAETAPFKGEPARDSLTMPPTGYQTPSPSFAYGTGPKESLNRDYNPAAGKY